MNGLKTGSKAIVNQSAKAGAGLISLGQWEPDNVIPVDPAKDLYYDQAALPARIAAEAAIAAATMGASQAVQAAGAAGNVSKSLQMANKVVKGLELADTGGNLLNGAKATADIAKNGLNLQNGADLVAGAIGAGQTAKALKGATDAVGDAAGGAAKAGNEAVADVAGDVAEAAADVGKINVGCFIAGTPVLLSAVPSQLFAAGRFDGDDHRAWASAAAQSLAIEDVPLGSRISTQNPVRDDIGGVAQPGGSSPGAAPPNSTAQPQIPDPDTADPILNRYARGVKTLHTLRE